MHVEVLLAVGYAGLLLAIAGGLEALARHTAVRAQRYRTAGFTYHPEHDLWSCPRDEPLWPHEVDRVHRLVRYRARPAVCNACPVKADCTDSHTGREVVRPVDPWPHSEAGRFHRGLSVALTTIAAAFVAAATARYHAPTELVVEAAAAAVTGWLMWRWARDFLHTPTGFPEISPVRHGDDPRGTADHSPPPSAGSALVDPLPAARARPRTVWGFDRQPSGRGYRPTDAPARRPDSEEDQS